MSVSRSVVGCSQYHVLELLENALLPHLPPRHRRRNIARVFLVEDVNKVTIVRSCSRMFSFFLSCSLILIVTVVLRGLGYSVFIRQSRYTLVELYVLELIVTVNSALKFKLHRLRCQPRPFQRVLVPIVYGYSFATSTDDINVDIRSQLVNWWSRPRVS